jgi:hypothetical protein
MGPSFDKSNNRVASAPRPVAPKRIMALHDLRSCLVKFSEFPDRTERAAGLLISREVLLASLLSALGMEIYGLRSEARLKLPRRSSGGRER